MAGEIGRATASFAVSSDKAVAYGAALKSMGARAESSGSAIGRSMVEIEKAILKGGEKMQWLAHITGMTADEIEQTFAVDSTIVFNKWIEGMANAQSAGVSTITMLEKMGMTGVETIKGITPLS